MDDETRELMARRPPTDSATVDEVRAMPIEALRDLFDRGGFPVTVSWDELIAIRSAK